MSDFAFDLTLRDYETARVQHTTDIDIKNWKYLKLEKAVIMKKWKRTQEYEKETVFYSQKKISRWTQLFGN